jgi:hypothetical protein
MKGSRLARSTTGWRPLDHSIGSSTSSGSTQSSARRARRSRRARRVRRWPRRWSLQRRQAQGQEVEQFLVKFLLARERAIAGAEHLVLEGLEFRGDESLGGFHGLAAQIVRRNRIRLAAVDLDEKALHAVEAELEAGQAAALALARSRSSRNCSVLLPSRRSSSSSAS